MSKKSLRNMSPMNNAASNRSSGWSVDSAAFIRQLAWLLRCVCARLILALDNSMQCVGHRTFSIALLSCVSLAAALVVAPLTAFAQAEEPAFEIYNAQGQAVSLADLIDAMREQEVVFIGELHNDPTAHAAELELLRGAFARYGQSGDKSTGRPVALSLEMFERDVQPLLDEYLANLILERQFLAGSRPWNNYQTDYRPLIEFARANKFPALAANAPERYVNRVSRLGRDALKDLSPPARAAWLAPQPYGAASVAYAEKFKRVMSGMPAGTPGAHGSPHGNPHLLDAQALRDATMAHTIAEHLKQNPHALVVHVNGNFHSEGRLGIPEHLSAYRPQTRFIVVTVAGSEAPVKIEAESLKQLGDFVIYTKRTASQKF